jgi:c-di-GMP-binding flagellar brake protein YcgR
MNGRKVVPPERDRRRTERVGFKPLHVRVDKKHKGILVDLSEGGALLQLPTAPPQVRQITVEIEWRDAPVWVQGRVVRSIQRQVQLESATLARTEYYVAVEFLELAPETAAAVQRILQSNY